MSIKDLRDVMRRLRDPDSGCPWDRAQSMESIVPYTIEEAYEVADAVERGELSDLADELGDLLFQVVFLARLAEERDLFSFEDVVAAIVAKLIRRHPHVFGCDSGSETTGGEWPRARWEQIKAEERRVKSSGSPGVLDGITAALPALQRARKLQERAATVGFDWPCAEDVLGKLTEELDELREATARLDGGSGLDENGKSEWAGAAAREAVEAELGDVLFTSVNLARHLMVDPAQALRGASRRFEARFRHIEDDARRRGRSLSGHSADELDQLWKQAKRALHGRDAPG